MKEAIDLLKKHLRLKKGVLLDANILLVYAVAGYDPRMIPRFHHTKQYSEDVDWIVRLVALLGTIYTSPHVLTEVSNLARISGRDST